MIVLELGQYAGDHGFLVFPRFNLGEPREKTREDFKVSICTLASGVDFLGWVHFLDHRVLRTATKRRMMRRLAEHPGAATVASYQGLLGHGNAFGIAISLEKSADFSYIE